MADLGLIESVTKVPIKGINTTEILALFALLVAAFAGMMAKFKHEENKKKIDSDAENQRTLHQKESEAQQQLITTLVEQTTKIGSQLETMNNNFHEISRTMAVHVAETKAKTEFHDKRLDLIDTRVEKIEGVLRS